ncbi:MAG: PRC-barrel domain-containing protein [Candidatus Njordarchaeales archaeon]
MFNEQLTVDLYEIKFPGKIVGKEVIDQEAKRLGIVKNIRLKTPPLRLFLVVRNKDIDVEIPFEHVDKIGKNIIKLRKVMDVEELSVEEAIKILENVKTEIITDVHLLINGRKDI